MTIVWVLWFQTSCGALPLLTDAPTCWRDLSGQYGPYPTLEQCQRVVDEPPAGGTFKCEARYTGH